MGGDWPARSGSGSIHAIRQRAHCGKSKPFLPWEVEWEAVRGTVALLLQDTGASAFSFLSPTALFYLIAVSTTHYIGRLAIHQFG